MHIRGKSVIAVLIMFAVLTGSSGQNNDGGYKRQLDEARKELKIETLKGDRLIELLADDSYYSREAAQLELIRRDVAEYDRILAATGDADPERRRRAESTLGRIAGVKYRELAKKRDPTVTLAVTNPRFWSGTNAWKGGIPDESLDADVAIKSDLPLEGVTSPLPVKEAKTDTGEAVETLLWGFSSCSTTSGVVYLTKPQLPFKTIEATLYVRGITRGDPDKATEKFEDGKRTFRKDVLWGELVEPKRDGKCQLIITDALGRLDKAQVKLLDKEGKASAAKCEVSLGSYRRVWSIDTEGGKQRPATFVLDVPGPAFYVEKAIKVSIAHPARR